MLNFGEEDTGSYADEDARGWYYDGEASRPFHQLDASIVAQSLHCYIAIDESEVKQEEDVPMGASKSRGLPHLPAALAWPPNTLFLAQLNLEELQQHDVQQLLPPAGMLYFFFNPGNQDCTVYHYTGSLEHLVRRPYPEDGYEDRQYYSKKYEDTRYRLSFQKEAALCIDNLVEHLPAAMKDKVEGILGCALVDNNIGQYLFGPPGYWQGENEVFDEEQLEEEADLLLFQYEFGEGHIHFWIGREELLQQNFSKVYLTYSGT